MTDHVCDFQPEAKSGIRICTEPTCRKVERKGSVASGGQHSSGEGDAVRDVLWKALQKYKLSNMSCSDDAGIGYPMVDLMSNDGTSIATGREEMLVLADHLSEALSKSAALSAAPVAETAGGAVGVVSGCARADLYTADLPIGTSLYAAPVPAQDDDKLREAIGHMSWMRNFVPCVFDVTEDRLNEIDDFISQEEAALKSTAAKEGGSK